jgi:hypothetical protein
MRVGWVLGDCREPDRFFVADDKPIAFVLTRVCIRLGKLTLNTNFA